MARELRQLFLNGIRFIPTGKLDVARAIKAAAARRPSDEQHVFNIKLRPPLMQDGFRRRPRQPLRIDGQRRR